MYIGSDYEAGCKVQIAAVSPLSPPPTRTRPGRHWFHI